MRIMPCRNQIPHDRHYRTFIRFSTLAVNPGIHKNWIPGSRPGMTNKEPGNDERCRHQLPISPAAPNALAFR